MNEDLAPKDKDPIAELIKEVKKLRKKIKKLKHTIRRKK